MLDRVTECPPIRHALSVNHKHDAFAGHAQCRELRHSHHRSPRP